LTENRERDLGFFTTWEFGHTGSESEIGVHGALGPTERPVVTLSIEVGEGFVRVELPADRAKELAARLEDEVGRAERLFEE